MKSHDALMVAAGHELDAPDVLVIARARAVNLREQALIALERSVDSHYAAMVLRGALVKVSALALDVAERAVTSGGLSNRRRGARARAHAGQRAS